MDLMRDFVRDRTTDLQRLAADVRRERDLGEVTTPSAGVPAPVAPHPRTRAARSAGSGETTTR